MPLCTEQELLDFMRETAYKPMTHKELESHFGIEDAAEFKQFLKLLAELEQEGKVLLTRSNRYGVPERMNLLKGRIQTHPKGFAFFIPEDREHPDLYFHANDMKGTMNGDLVLARVSSKNENGKLEGEIVRIVKRAVTQVVGLFHNHESFGFVEPDDKRITKDIFVRSENFMGAVTGQKVVANIITYPEGRTAAEGEIIEILGHKDDPGVDILSIIRKHGLPESFPGDVLVEAEAAPDSITEAEIAEQGRRDLRNKAIVTIDGEDAKDLDDAVNVERLPNGNYLLGVHIADVGYYVREKSKLDEEAYNRGCSVYLVDRVIPMLPHRLSNGICSLNPRVDRLTLSCEMEFEPGTMKRVRYDVFTSVIKTVERMTYTNVRKILNEEDPEVTERYADLVDTFKLMQEMALGLRSMRMRRGAIDFDFQESKVLVDEQGKPVDIVKRERTIAEQIIEEFMLAANETVAEHFHWLKVPFIYRIHEEPTSEKLMTFMQFASNFGYTVRGGKGNAVHPRALQTLLEQIHGTKEETVLSTMMLRSMKQAKYDSESLGHFGLAADYYTHFTSPIRRYPDLVIHRVMREVFENGGTLPESRFDALNGRMQDIALQSSERERVAVDAERDTAKLKKAEYMLDKIGEEFTGIISGVTSFGMFIELENTVEGLIRLSELSDDYYHFHEQHMMLVGERTSRTFRIGDEVEIRVARVNMSDHTIDFEMVNMKPRSAGRGGWDAVRSGGGFGPGGPGGGNAARKRKKLNASGRFVGIGGGESRGGGHGGKSSGRGEDRRGRKGRGAAADAGDGEWGAAPASVPDELDGGFYSSVVSGGGRRKKKAKAVRANAASVPASVPASEAGPDAIATGKGSVGRRPEESGVPRGAREAGPDASATGKGGAGRRPEESGVPRSAREAGPDANATGKGGAGRRPEGRSDSGAAVASSMSPSSLGVLSGRRRGVAVDMWGLPRSGNYKTIDDEADGGKSYGKRNGRDGGRSGGNGRSAGKDGKSGRAGKAEKAGKADSNGRNGGKGENDGKGENGGDRAGVGNAGAANREAADRTDGSASPGKGKKRTKKASKPLVQAEAAVPNSAGGEKPTRKRKKKKEQE